MAPLNVMNGNHKVDSLGWALTGGQKSSRPIKFRGLLPLFSREIIFICLVWWCYSLARETLGPGRIISWSIPHPPPHLHHLVGCVMSRRGGLKTSGSCGKHWLIRVELGYSTSLCFICWGEGQKLPFRMYAPCCQQCQFMKHGETSNFSISISNFAYSVRWKRYCFQFEVPVAYMWTCLGKFKCQLWTCFEDLVVWTCFEDLWFNGALM